MFFVAVWKTRGGLVFNFLRVAKYENFVKIYRKFLVFQKKN